MAEEPPTKKKKKKRSDTSGWSKKVNDKKITKIKSHKVLGEWRRWGMVKVNSVRAFVKWERATDLEAGEDSSDDEPSVPNVVTFTTPVPVGMKNVLVKMEKAQNRTYGALPIAIKEQFELDKSSYNPIDFTVSVSFGKEVKYEEFNFAYCHLCSNKKKLEQQFWAAYPNELPEEVSVANLMENWDKFNLSWNQVLGYLLLNQEQDTLNKI